LVLALLVVLTGGACRRNSASLIAAAPEARQGLLDLRGHDISRRSATLSGEYEFFWRKFVPARAPDGADSAAAHVPDAYAIVPGAWNALVVGSQGEAIGGDGFATYRLRVLLRPSGNLGLRVPTMHTAFRLYVNGELLCANGRPGKTAAESRPGYFPQVVEIPGQVDRLDLVLHISNFHHRKGGTWTHIDLGDVALLGAARERGLLFDFFLFGSVLIMGFYHCGLFLMRRRDRSTLYFGLFCLLVAVRIFTTGEHYLLQLLPDMDWDWYVKIQYWGFYLAVPAFGSFAYHAFPHEFPPWLYRLGWFFGGAFALIVLFTPARIFSYTMDPYQIWTVLAGLAMIAVLLLSLHRKRDGAFLYMIGWLILFTTMVNDILYNSEIVQTILLVPLGFFLFVVMQSIFLALRISRAFETAERLSETLEDAIHERTRELEDSRDQLEVAKEQAERSDRAKSEFLATMSHEIRTPLNSILGTASLLEESTLSGEQKEQVSILNRAGHRLLTLINEILDLSKIEAGKLNLESVPFSVREVLADLQGLMGNRARLKGIMLESICPPDVPERSLGDPDRLAQVLLNLVSNAIKFTERGGVTLNVEIVRRDQQAVVMRFSVTDTGIGIAPDKQQRIFESFVQADQDDARRYEGTGLGLAISRRLVELMGGHLYLESEEGEGSVFWFDIRLLNAQPGEVATRAAVADRAPGFAIQPGLKILLADDNPDNRYLVQVYLKHAEAALQIVENGREAVDRVRVESFDLILMDIQMPVMDGYEAVRAIREWEASSGRSRATILALTADATREAYNKAIAAGCNGYLTKPIQKNTLLDAVAGIDR
jgi:signal transduction histidine kinase